jgi:hypothetical protein
MPRYVIEREIPGIQLMAAEELKAASQTSCNVLRELGNDIQWIESFVTEDKLYCVYFSKNEELIRDHACRGNFPANRIAKLHTVIGPYTAE